MNLGIKYSTKRIVPMKKQLLIASLICLVSSVSLGVILSRSPIKIDLTITPRHFSDRIQVKKIIRGQNYIFDIVVTEPNGFCDPNVFTDPNFTNPNRLVEDTTVFPTNLKKVVAFFKTKDIATDPNIIIEAPVTVYHIKISKKFHLRNCIYIDRRTDDNLIAILKEDALIGELTPCRKCKP